jgi:hypothetical protein
MQNLLFGFTDSTALWNLFKEIGLAGRSRCFEKRSRGKTKNLYLSKAVLKALK